MRPPRLRTVLLAVHLLVLLLPIAAVSLLRLYDNTLIRQTEAELVAQGAVVAAAYRRELEHGLTAAGPPALYGSPRRSTPDAGASDGRFRPIPARLDLARHEVLPPAPPAAAAQRVAPAAGRAGGSLAGLLREVQEVTLAGLRVVDPRGTVVATSGAELGDSLAHREEVAAALAGRSASVLRRRDEEGPRPALDSLSRRTPLRVVVALPVLAGGRVWGAVVLARTPLAPSPALSRDRRHLLAGAAAVLAVVAAISLLAARTLGRPLGELVEQTARVRRGEPARPLAHPGTREVARISHAVAEMAHELRQRADTIADFATNVSHAFKTPLTSMRGTTELLRDHLPEMTPAERERFLGMLESDARYLERLVARLLELARAGAAPAGREATEVAPVLDELAERFRGRGLAVEIEGQSVGLTVAMAPAALTSILANLLDNARQHGGPGVRVRLAARRGPDGRIALRVADDGPGVSPASRERVFERFFTTARDRGGSGLGLAIVRSLVESHGGVVELTSRPGRTELAVLLPAG